MASETGETLQRAAIEDRLRRAAEAMRQDADRRWWPVARLLTIEADYAERECVPVANAAASVADVYLDATTRRPVRAHFELDEDGTVRAWGDPNG